MHFLLGKVFAVIAREGWKLSLVTLLLAYVVGAVSMRYFEPSGSDLASLPVYSWWFFVTATTVGYGDYAPSTLGGRLIAIVIMLGGIGSIGMIITQIATIFSDLMRRTMQGLAQLNERNHIVIFGYYPGKTEHIVKEIIADKYGKKSTIVLCFAPDQSQENPLPEQVKAVKGRLTSYDVLQRACVVKAERVIVDGKDDNESLAIVVAIVHVNKTAHIVSALHDVEEKVETFQRVSKKIECVPWGMVTMIVQALQDPGISRLYSNLLSNLRGHSGFRLDIPKNVRGVLYGDLFTFFKNEYDATLIGVANSYDSDAEIVENPPCECAVNGGMSIYYISGMRLTDIDWDSLIHQKEELHEETNV